MPQNPDKDEQYNVTPSAVPTKRKAEHFDDEEPGAKRQQSEFIKSILKQGPSTKSERVTFASESQEEVLAPDVDRAYAQSRISDDFRLNSMQQVIGKELEKIYREKGDEAVKDPKFQLLNQRYHQIEQYLVEQSGLSKDEYNTQKKESEKYAAGMREEARAQWKSASYDRNAKVGAANADLQKEVNAIIKDVQQEPPKPTLKDALLAKIARDKAASTKKGFEL